jgi:hypothetical protein
LPHLFGLFSGTGDEGRLTIKRCSAQELTSIGFRSSQNHFRLILISGTIGVARRKTRVVSEALKGDHRGSKEEGSKEERYGSGHGD